MEENQCKWRKNDPPHPLRSMSPLQIYIFYEETHVCTPATDTNHVLFHLPNTDYQTDISFCISSPPSPLPRCGVSDGLMLVCWTLAGRSVAGRTTARPAIRRVIPQHWSLLCLLTSSKYDIITVFIFLACHFYLDKLSQTPCHGLSPPRMPKQRRNGQKWKECRIGLVLTWQLVCNEKLWAKIKEVLTCTGSWRGDKDLKRGRAILISVKCQSNVFWWAFAPQPEK